MVVALAIAAIEVQTSGNTVAPSKPGLPSGEYGYRERSFSGKEQMVGEQHAVEAGFLGGARERDELLGLGEREHLPELHALCFSAG